jgi:hypothetical protein
MPAPFGRPAERLPFRREPQTPPMERDEGLALLEGVKAQLSEEERRRTANRVAQLFMEDRARKEFRQAQRAPDLREEER